MHDSGLPSSNICTCLMGSRETCPIVPHRPGGPTYYVTSQCLWCGGGGEASASLCLACQRALIAAGRPQRPVSIPSAWPVAESEQWARIDAAMVRPGTYGLGEHDRCATCGWTRHLHSVAKCSTGFRPPDTTVTAPSAPPAH